MIETSTDQVALARSLGISRRRTHRRAEADLIAIPIIAFWGSPAGTDVGKLKVRAGGRYGERLMKGNLVQSMALFGTVAAMLTVTVMVTLSHATFSMSGVGSLKCYVTAGIEKAC